MDESAPRYSLVNGEGNGAMLGLVAGDSAGGAWELGYSAHTEQATVLAYHLIEHGALVPARLVEALRELDGTDGDDPVYRSESSSFRSWLDRSATGSPDPDPEPSLDPCPRAVPLGVVNRRDPAKLDAEVMDLGLIFHSDALTILSGAVVASAVAASCFGQTGRDLLAGVSEGVIPVVEMLNDRQEVVNKSGLAGAADDLAKLDDLYGLTDGEEALIAVGGDRPWDVIRAGLLIAAPVPGREHLPVEQAARIGGSALAAAVGGIIGARVGIRAWPWAFANDTWFAEIGRRMVRGPAEVRDLPIPYAVEQHLMSGEPRSLHP